MEKPRPDDPRDIWSDSAWASHVERVAKEIGPAALQTAKEGSPGHPAYVPLDPSLLERITFVGVPVSELEQLLRVRQPAFIPNQPFGAAAFRMWPDVDPDCALVLELEWEIDDDLVPVVTSEALERQCDVLATVCCNL